MTEKGIQKKKSSSANMLGYTYFIFKNSLNIFQIKRRNRGIWHIIIREIVVKIKKINKYLSFNFNFV